MIHDGKLSPTRVVQHGERTLHNTVKPKDCIVEPWPSQKSKPGLPTNKMVAFFLCNSTRPLLQPK